MSRNFGWGIAFVYNITDEERVCFIVRSSLILRLQRRAKSCTLLLEEHRSQHCAERDGDAQV